MVDTLATEHQISDGVGVSIGPTPADGFTASGAHPDHAFLSPQFGDPKGVVHVGCPVATVGIELAPCGGLDGDGVVHRFRLTEVSIEPRAMARSAHCATCSTGFFRALASTQTPRMGDDPDANCLQLESGIRSIKVSSS